jgi:hypothetical protein
MEKVDGSLSCVSKRSAVEIESLGLVAYACPEGIMTIGQQGALLASAECMTREDWNDLYNPSSISAFYWQGKYVAFFTNGAQQAGFMFDFGTKDLVNLDFYATGGYHDPIDGRLYLVINGEIMSFSDTETLRNYIYLSKKYRFLPTSFGALKVVGTGYPVAVNLIFRDVPETLQLSVPSTKPIRIPNVGLVDNCEIEITGTAQVSGLYLAGSMGELPV